jgi:hypothetical protein
VQCSIYQFLIVGVLLTLVFAWKVIDVGELLKRYLPDKAHVVVEKLLRLIIGIIAVILLIEPLIPGAAVVEVHAPPGYAKSLSNLTVRLTPMCSSGGRSGPATTGRFDNTGVALVPVEFRVLQVEILAQLLDSSDSRTVSQQQHVPVSVLNRLKITKLIIVFKTEVNNVAVFSDHDGGRARSDGGVQRVEVAGAVD